MFNARMLEDEKTLREKINNDPEFTRSLFGDSFDPDIDIDSDVKTSDRHGRTWNSLLRTLKNNDQKVLDQVISGSKKRVKFNLRKNRRKYITL
uniref:Uncharacterized protein n=1 Tax=viral metagenome TaxID=1070528 RepID=A0A6C0JRH2_9ZZZZ